MIVYIAGPVTGIPDLNLAAFEGAKALVRARGLTPLSPRDIPIVEGGSWEYYMRKALQMMLTADVALFLPGWESSKGARFERSLAEMLDMPIWDFEIWRRRGVPDGAA